MYITPLHIAVPLAIAAFAVVAQLPKNHFLMLAAWGSLGFCMAFTLNNLVQAFLQLAQVVR